MTEDPWGDLHRQLEIEEEIEQRRRERNLFRWLILTALVGGFALFKIVWFLVTG
jgi:hypothetical protein